MSRTFHKRPPKKFIGPPPSIVEPLREITLLLVALGQRVQTDETAIHAALKATFGSMQKGYGSIIALRNALRSARALFEATSKNIAEKCDGCGAFDTKYCTCGVDEGDETP